MYVLLSGAWAKLVLLDRLVKGECGQCRQILPGPFPVTLRPYVSPSGVPHMVIMWVFVAKVLVLLSVVTRLLACMAKAPLLVVIPAVYRVATLA